MYLIAIAWLYVALMMAVAEATHPQGSVFGALVTFTVYGLAPLALVLYLAGTPMRWKARRQAEAAELEAARRRAAAPVDSAPLDPDRRGHAPAASVEGNVAPVREEP